MRNITVTVQDETYREIRAWCAQRDTCVSHVVQDFLNDLPRLKEVRRFPLPAAPDRGSIGAQFDRLLPNRAEQVDQEEILDDGEINPFQCMLMSVLKSPAGGPSPLSPVSLRQKTN